MSHRPTPLLLLALSLSAPVAADVTQRTVLLGESGAPTCGDHNDPPTLDDGLTPASAEVRFEYDSIAHTLTVTLANTSPITAGVPNPVLTHLYFNLPTPGVTDLALLSQSAAGGDPGWVLQIDSDLHDGSNPLTSGCFGAFGAHLVTENANVKGAIANPGADTVAASGAVDGPATFTLHVVGPGADTLNASAFASTLSTNPPGSGGVPVSAKFQGGGILEASGTLASAPNCHAAGWYVGEPCLGETLTFVLESAPGCHACLLVSDNPGPTPYQGDLVPIGPPVHAFLVVDSFPPSGIVTKDVTIPDEVGLVGMSFHFVAAGVDPVTLQGLSFGNGFSVTICP